MPRRSARDGLQKKPSHWVNQVTISDWYSCEPFEKHNGPTWGVLKWGYHGRMKTIASDYFTKAEREREKRRVQKKLDEQPNVGW